VESILALLPALACPVGMGLLMWLMMRGNQSDATGGQTSPPAGRATAPTLTDAGDRLVQLRAQLAEVLAQQAAITTQLEQLQAGGPLPQPGEIGPTEPRQPAAAPPRQTV